MRSSAVKPSHLPRISKTMLLWFQWYCRGYLKKNVNSIRVAGAENLRAIGDRPVVVCMNHPSWWDPLIAAFLAETFLSERDHYAPIDSAALEKYSFFRKLGFFGVEKDTARGARTFLETSLAITSATSSCLWITVQGRFSDVRERPVVIAPGIGHLLHRADCTLVPMAIELVHWEERTPEVLVKVGAVTQSVDHASSAQEWNAFVAASLQKLMDELAAETIARNAAAFDILLGGSAGVGGVYDRWRAFKSRSHGRTFDARHSRISAK